MISAHINDKIISVQEYVEEIFISEDNYMQLIYDVKVAKSKHFSKQIPVTTKD
jgi:hypothetical protein